MAEKNCLNCAYCIRNKDTLIGGMYISNPHWRYDENSLSSQERKKILLNDDSFIGQEIRNKKQWLNEYESWYSDKNKKNDMKQLSTIENLQRNIEGVNIMMNPREYYCRETKSPACPDAPNEDYLSCYRDEWNENRSPELIKDRISYLKEHKCNGFYDFKKSVHKTLDVCIEEQKNSTDKKRFWVAFWVASILASVSIVVSIFFAVN